jgi:hypothetical protein
MGSGNSRAAEKWQKLIEGQRRSGMSIAAYCRKKGIPDSGFYQWRKRLGRKPQARLKDFVKLSVPTGQSPRDAVRIRTPGGYCVEVPSGTKGEFLKEVLASLAGLR